MKARFEYVRPTRENRSIVSYLLELPEFEFNWHYHPEFELTMILSGRGSRLVGDRAESYRPGDLALLGADLPHSWQSERSSGVCRAVVVQFDATALSGLCALEEMADVARLLDAASRGLHFPDGQTLEADLHQLVDASGPSRVSRLIDILGRLTELKTRPLASPGHRPARDDRLKDRLDTVFRYVAESYTHDVTQARASALVHMTEAAFSRYFRRMTGMTFTQYVIDLRVSHACALLQTTSEPIASIAYDAGFGSLANFNRRFKERLQVTPRAYRARFATPR
ncbi:MAG: AraC family transcriptional regulator [Rhodothermales bacterium]|nr:AraC family transcriptional regulator [Rhodothermales bacterium]MBO6778082.1 AraC family transcriptional regulator [Rhodothermales bacterium]